MLHGREVPDPYRWLESTAADDESASARAAWSAAQRELYEQQSAAWVMRDHFADRMGNLLSGGYVSTPVWRGERQFFMRRTGEQQFGILLTVDPDGTERELIDPVKLDPTGLTTLDGWQPSKEGHLLAYQLSEGGTEESVLRVMDVATGDIVDGPIDRTRYSPVAWLPGGAAFYYVRRIEPDLLPEGETQFHRRVYLHRLGSPAAQDVLVFGAGMTMTNYYGVSVSMDGRWLQISASEGTEPRNDLWLADLTTTAIEAPAFRLVQGDVDAQTSLTFGRDGRLYIGTDRDAPRGRICVSEPARPEYEHWQDLIPEDPESVLEDTAVLDGIELDRPLLLVSRTRHAQAELHLHDLATGAHIEQIPLPGSGTLGGLVERPDGGPVSWFTYTDHATQPHVYQFDGRTRELTLFATPPGIVDVPKVFSRQVDYTSADGTTVRMFVISPTETPDRPRPTVLYGYGGFGISLNPGYSAATLAWVEAGGVWAVASLRGGGEEGEEWHRAGMLGEKQRVFEDFEAAAEHLVSAGWTTPAQLAVEGGSNGGLLVGALMTRRPELVNAVACAAPLLDMVRYVTSELGATWTVEYGDPAVPQELDWLLGYSPYHRVQEGVDYPALLMMVFDNDTRTDPMHGRKFVAAVQHATTGDRPLMIRAEGDVGHGARSLDRAVSEASDMLAFLAHWTGLEQERS